MGGLALFTTLALYVTRAARSSALVNAPPRGLSSWPGNATSYEDPAYRDAMLVGCGELCDTSILGTPSLFFNETRKRFDCMAFYGNRDNDAPAPVWPSPMGIPLNLWDDYQMNDSNHVWIHQWYIEERYSGTTGMQPTWTVAEIEGMKAQALQDTLPGNYGWGTTSMIWGMMKRYEHLLRGKHAFVIGSETPWVEAMLLAIGAEHVTTIEYGTIISQHPNVSTMTPAQVTERFLATNGAEPKFDVAVTFSSLEHSGLGRYGDTLNPWGDIQAVAKAWCITTAAVTCSWVCPRAKGTKCAGTRTAPTASTDGPTSWRTTSRSVRQREACGVRTTPTSWRARANSPASSSSRCLSSSERRLLLLEQLKLSWILPK